MTAIVEQAVMALRLFGPIDRVRAGQLLNMWRHRDELSTDEAREVIDRFPPRRAER